ncbi:MAG: hypothetical protein H6737_28710 [Alphaproteobacteria bacterium]|nr:hypothetical protein [Alphaproteobacteria bacterium]
MSMFLADVVGEFRVERVVPVPASEWVDWVLGPSNLVLNDPGLSSFVLRAGRPIPLGNIDPSDPLYAPDPSTGRVECTEGPRFRVGDQVFISAVMGDDGRLFQDWSSILVRDATGRTNNGDAIPVTDVGGGMHSLGGAYTPWPIRDSTPGGLPGMPWDAAVAKATGVFEAVESERIQRPPPSPAAVTSP